MNEPETELLVVGAGRYVIRPDGHVGFRSAGTDMAWLVKWLRRAFECLA
jgi:hypothetical protein